jgi:hypothetical protein
MIHRTVDNIISFVYVQYTTWTDQYSSRYGPAKFDVAMASFEVKTRRAITLSILVRWRQFFHSNAVNDVEYRWCNRGTMGKRSDQTRHNIAAWRQISWFVDGIWRFMHVYSNIFLRAIVHGWYFWVRKARAWVELFCTLCNCGCYDCCIWYVRWTDNTISTYVRTGTKN